MKFVGIDLSGPRNFADTCLVSFEEVGDEIHLQNFLQGASDKQILEVISNLKTDSIMIGIDAPLSYNSTGGDRESDAQLRRLVNSKGRGIGIMPPTLTKMVYLTLRGITLARLLETLQPKLNLQIVEVHPGASMFLHGADIEDVKNFKKVSASRLHLLNWLETKGLKNIIQEDKISDHYVAACGAAFGAWQWKSGNSVWKFPANLPYHPYDFAC